MSRFGPEDSSHVALATKGEQAPLPGMHRREKTDKNDVQIHKVKKARD